MIGRNWPFKASAHIIRIGFNLAVLIVRYISTRKQTFLIVLINPNLAVLVIEDTSSYEVTIIELLFNARGFIIEREPLCILAILLIALENDRYGHQASILRRILHCSRSAELITLDLADYRNAAMAAVLTVPPEPFLVAVS